MFPQRRAKISANGGNLCATATVFIKQQPKFTEHVGPQYHLRRYAAQYDPQFRSLPPFNTAHYPPQKKSDWPSCDTHYCHITLTFLFLTHHILIRNMNFLHTQ